MFLLDTNCCIDFTLGRSGALRNRVKQAYRAGLAISAVTLAELRVGARSAQADPGDERRLDILVGLLTVHPFDDRAAAEYGSVASKSGIKRGSFDRLIAAHALALDLTLVTNNERDFSDIAGLRVENWTLAL